LRQRFRRKLGKCPWAGTVEGQRTQGAAYGFNAFVTLSPTTPGGRLPGGGREFTALRGS
jgi:hypothetical protein